jgi:hypothetical protein
MMFNSLGGINPLFSDHNRFLPQDNHNAQTELVLIQRGTGQRSLETPLGVYLTTERGEE